MPGRIFINYRRGDDPGNTGRLFDRLQEVFPPQQLFLDVDNIAPGLDFTRELNNRVAQCDILLAIIGKGWIDARDANGERRLDDPEDFVRIEIASALRQGKRVIPILVGDAHMPRPDELPKPLRPLAHRNAVRLTHERFRADTQGLIKALKEALGEAEAPTVSKKIQLPVQPTILVAGIAAAVFGGAFAYWQLHKPDRPSERPAAVAAPPQEPLASGGCHTENYTFSAVLSQSARAESVSTEGAACFYKVAPIHPDQVQFTSASIVEQPSNGSFEQTGDFAFKYQPRPGFKGTDEYAIKVCGHNSQRAGCATITYGVTAK